MYNQGIPSGPAPDSGAVAQPAEAAEPPQQAQPAAQPAQKPAPKLGTRAIIAIAVVVIAIVGFALYARTPSNGTTTTTTVPIIHASAINSCGKISGPGNFYLSSDLRTSIQSGACINVTADNVALVCNQHSIIGAGPYSGLPPYTYGILVEGRSNVSVSGCGIANFSFGVYSQSSSMLSVLGGNLTNNYISNVYLSATQNSSVGGNRMSGGSGMQGSLALANGSSNNRIFNNRIQDSRFYAIGVNSAGNSYINNTLDNNPSSFYCGVESSFPRSSAAVGNICRNNTGCAFVSCKGFNVPANLSSIALGSRINSCGSVLSPGSYSMQSNLNMALFVNSSNPIYIASNTPCIAIRSSNSRLDCMGHAISNASVAVLVDAKSNVTVTNCSVSRSGYGVKLINAAGATVSNITLRNNTFALFMQNVSSSVIDGIRSFGSKYGMYMTDALSDTFSSFNSSKNQYGVYLGTSSGNLFFKGTLFNNSAIDVYATPDSVNASYNLMQQTGCGLSNAKWATCNQYVSTLLTYYPVSGCTTISRQGNYSLTANLVSPSAMCFVINADNVTFSCSGHSLFQTADAPGPVFYVNGRKNVTIRNCVINGFTSAVNVTNSEGVGVYDIVTHSSRYGITLVNVTSAVVENNTLSNAANASLKLQGVSGSSIIKNNLTYGVGRNFGMLIDNSQDNLIVNNTGSTNYIGMYFTGISRNNTVLNNLMQLSGFADYQCNGNSGINAELGTINYGTKKLGCTWMAALIKGAEQVPCAAALQPTTVLLTSDAEYGYGAVCYSVYSNGTTINCNGHTVVSTSGGTFAMFRNATRGLIENCNLKGFDAPIAASGSSVAVINNTVFMNAPRSAAIDLTGGSGSSIRSNNVTAPYLGISILRATASSLLNNIVALATAAYQIAGSYDLTLQNNTALSSTGTGMVLSNTTGSFVSGNRLQGKGGIVCLSTSQGSTNNTDSGSNACTSNAGCQWIQGSAGTCH